MPRTLVVLDEYFSKSSFNKAQPQPFVTWPREKNVFKWHSTNKQEEISAQIEDLSLHLSVEEVL